MAKLIAREEPSHITNWQTPACALPKLCVEAPTSSSTGTLPGSAQRLLSRSYPTSRLIGTVLDRRKITGTSAKGPWEIYKVEIRGEDGRVQTCSLHDAASAPAIGSFCVIPVVLGQNGGLRDARPTGEAF